MADCSAEGVAAVLGEFVLVLMLPLVPVDGSFSIRGSLTFGQEFTAPQSRTSCLLWRQAMARAGQKSCFQIGNSPINLWIIQATSASSMAFGWALV